MSQQSSTKEIYADIILREKWLIWTSGRHILPNCRSLIIVEQRGEAFLGVFYLIDYF